MSGGEPVSIPVVVPAFAATPLFFPVAVPKFSAVFFSTYLIPVSACFFSLSLFFQDLLKNMYKKRRSDYLRSPNLTLAGLSSILLCSSVVYNASVENFSIGEKFSYLYAFQRGRRYTHHCLLDNESDTRHL